MNLYFSEIEKNVKIGYFLRHELCKVKGRLVKASLVICLAYVSQTTHF